MTNHFQMQIEKYVNLVFAITVLHVNRKKKCFQIEFGELDLERDP